MINSLVENQIKSMVRDTFGDKAVRIVKRIDKIAAKQGGSNAVENYRLLGKRALIVVGATVIVVQATASIIGLIVARRSEAQRVEKIVRRVLEEERQANEGAEKPAVEAAK